MKVKSIFKVSIALMIVGVIFTGVGYAMNGGLRLNDLGNLNNKEEKSIELINETKELKQFKNIDIDTEFNNIEIIPSNKYKIELKYDNSYGKINYKVNKETLVVTQKPRTKIKNHDLELLKNENRNNIKIYIPTNDKVNNLNIKCDASNIEIEGIDIDSLDILSNLGNILVRDCKIKNGEVVADAGNIELYNINALNIGAYSNLGNIVMNENDISDSLNIENDMGNIEVNGKIYGDIDLKNNLGNIELTINENKKLYNYKVDCDLGNGEVDGDNKVKAVNNNSKNNIKLDCSLGNIELNFK